MKKFLQISFLVSAILGLVVGACAGYLAWQHNPQCEFHCVEQGIHFGALLGVGGSWALVVSLASFTIFGVVPASIRGLLILASRGSMPNKVLNATASPRVSSGR